MTASRASSRVAKSSPRAQRGRTRTPAARTPPPERQAGYHTQTRQARSLEVAEDYVEAIAGLIDAEGEARVVDLSRRLGVTHVTVTRTVARLARAGLVTSRPYRSIFLTESGRNLAARVKRRHELVVRFLVAIGVPEEIARADAEGIEHHVSAETLAAFERNVRQADAARRRIA